MRLFSKQDPEKPVNVNLRIMHWINAIAISIFVIGICWKLIVWFLHY